MYCIKVRSFKKAVIRFIGNCILLYLIVVVFKYIFNNQHDHCEQLSITSKITNRWPVNASLLNRNSIIKTELFFRKKSYNHNVKIVDVPKNIKDHLFRNNTGLERTMALMKNKSTNNSTYGGVSYCGGNIEAIRHDFLYMRNVTLDISGQSSKRKGGEMLKGVLGQSDKDEVINMTQGLFRVQCTKTPQIKSIPPLFNKIKFIYNKSDNLEKFTLDSIPNFTVMIRRSYYSQMYYTFNELYLTYLTIRLFNKDPKNTTILYRDAHPFFKLDYIWKSMFKGVLRIGRLPKSVLINELVSVVVGPLPFHQAMKIPPFISDFKMHMYQSHGMPELDRTVCPVSLNDINITLILRQDFHANPQWKEGKIFRKIKNQPELISYLRLNLQRSKFSAVQLDNMKTEDQIRIICYTNILIAIHGAGLSYTILLRAGSSLIELFPSNNHFEQFAHWAKVHYTSHDGPHPYQEYIFVPPELALKFINESIDRIIRNCDLKKEKQQVL